MLTIVLAAGNWKNPNLTNYRIIGVFKVVNTNAAFLVSDEEFLSAGLICGCVFRGYFCFVPHLLALSSVMC